MTITASAPTRIDLAGGTLDIYPIYLWTDGGVTVNMAIEPMTRVRLSTRPDREIHIYSDSGGELHARDLDDLPLGQNLDLICRVLKYYRPASGIDLHTECCIPHGSGLGVSSSLLINLSGVLNHLNGSNLSPQEFIDYGANLEAQSIGIPTGKQDYFPPLHGLINAIWFSVAGIEVEPLVVEEATLRELETRVVLSFTGESHFSATSNWNMLKAYVENLGPNRENMLAIKRTAVAMREALLDADWDTFAALVHQEWQNRKHLAQGVTTPQIEKLIAAAARQGALASKICGAGGGGCMITVVPPARRDQVIKALEQNGAQHMPFSIARRGLQLREEP